MRVLYAVRVRFFGTHEIGASGNYEEVIIDVAIGDTIEDVIIDHMKYLVSEGVYLQNETVGVLFIPERYIYGVQVMGDSWANVVRNLFRY